MTHILCCWLRETDDYDLGATFRSDLFARIRLPSNVKLCIWFHSLQPYWIHVTSEGVVDFCPTIIRELGDFMRVAKDLYGEAKYSLIVSGEKQWRDNDIQRACSEACCKLEWLYLQQSYNSTTSLRQCVSYYLLHEGRAPRQMLTVRDVVRLYKDETVEWVTSVGKYIATTSNKSVKLIAYSSSAKRNSLVAVYELDGNFVVCLDVWA